MNDLIGVAVWHQIASPLPALLCFYDKPSVTGVWCSRAVGSRQSSPTDTNTQAASRLADNVLLSHQQLQHSMQLQQQNAPGQFEAPSSAAAAGTGLADAFFTTPYMMDSAQQADYNQQVRWRLSLPFSVLCVSEYFLNGTSAHYRPWKAGWEQNQPKVNKQ